MVLEYWFPQHFWRLQRGSTHTGPLSCQTGGLVGSEQRSLKLNEEVHHLMVFQVLFQTGILTLQMAKPQPDSPGTATG